MPAVPRTIFRLLRPTPGLFIAALVAVEGVLWLSERYRWFTFNEDKGGAVLTAIVVLAVSLVAMLFWFLFARVFGWSFQFGIRTLLVLTVAVAVPFSWLALEMKQAREQKAALEEFSRAGGAVINKNSYATLWLPADAAKWLRGLFGDDFFCDGATISLISTVSINGHTFHGRVTDAGTVTLRGLTTLKRLKVIDLYISDTTLKYLGELTALEELHLDAPRLTDAGSVYLERSGLTDAELVYLERLTELRELSLIDSSVTDAGLVHLKGLRKLKTLCLGGTQVTDAGPMDLQRALPHCRVVR